ncbi:antibiotic biosynthesis monooxygenase [Luteithermobacter gelatinilyticus]|uniref:antibiotic biosynthesis monooxygenase n=1 Tax=Luteithermobacter gelatinilyticus TaxID=2582913 RepID=UPI0011059D71|nr:antibiotic biosynthesis monooxygenase [Luteithermobacter gelatinilyticus]|tara:strand:- start:18285 stop:18887 length:603 start_codon:yes stop_codon:yes gene_type:complete
MYAEALKTPEICPEQDNEPVTVTISRKVKPGREKAYERWAKEVSLAAREFMGHQNLSIFRPSVTTGGRYVFMLHFDSHEHQQAWEQSPVRAAFLQRLRDEDLVEGETEIAKATGFEFWFPYAEVPEAAPPPRWKMVVIMIPTVVALVLLVNTLLAPLAGHWPVEVKIVVQCVFQILLMTYVIMPRLTTLFKGWLYPQKSS